MNKNSTSHLKRFQKTMTPAFPSCLALAGGIALLLALVFACALPARAGDFPWAAISGGNASGSWDNPADWTGDATPGINDTADFSQLDITVNSTITLDGNQSVNSLIFGNTDASPAANWALTPGTPSTSTLTLGGTSPTITVGNLGSGETATITSILAGSAGLNLAGPGQLVLSGSNTYSGGTIVSAGATLAIGTNSTTNAGGSVVTSPTGTGNVTLQNGVSIGNISSGDFWYAPQLNIQGTVNLVGGHRLSAGFNTIDLNGSQQTINVNSTSIVITNGATTSGAQSESTGISSMEINNYLGTLTVQNGTLDLETTVFPGGNGGAYGAFRFSSGAAVNFAGNGGLIVGSGVLLYVNNPFTATSPKLTINSGGYVDMVDNVLTVYSLAGSGTLGLSLTNSTTARTLTLNGASGTTTFSGVLQNGPGPAVLSVTKSGASTQVFSGQNTYTGTTTIAGGTFRLAGGSGSVLATAPFILDSATLDLNAQKQSVSTLSVNGNGVIMDSSGTGLGVLTTTGTGNTSALLSVGDSLTINSGTLTSSAQFAVNGVLTMAGGTLIVPNTLLNGYNALGGVVNLNSGVIKALTVGFGDDPCTYHFNGGTLITATLKNVTTTNATASLYFNGTTVQYLTNTTGFKGSFFPYANVLSANEHAYISSGGVTFVGVAGTNMIFSAPLLTDPSLGGAADGGLTMSGAGTLTFSAANTYTGLTTVNGGTIAIAAGGSLASAINVAGNGTLDVSGLGSSATFAMPGAYFAAGTNATIIGGAIGTVNLGSLPVTLTYNGTTPALTISQGTLALNGNAFTVNTSSGLPLPNGQYTIAQVLSGSISGSGNYAVTGTALPASGTTNFVSVSGGNLVLNIFNSTGAPVLTIDPPALTPAPPAVIYVTESFSLTSAAYGIGPLSYQWRLNGTNISGATGTTFSKSNATTNNSGNYVIVVTNPYGSTTSSIPTTVTVLNPAVSLTSGLNLWLKFDETTGLTAADSSGHGLNGTLQGFAGDDSQWVSGRIGGAINVNPYSGEQEVVAVQDNGSLNFSTNMEFSLAAWVNPASSQTSGAPIIAKGFGAGGEEYVLDVNGGTYRFYVRNASALATVYQTSTAPDGYWHQLTAVFSVPKSRVLVYLDGNVILTGTPPTSLLSITNEVDIGARMSGTNTGYDLDLNAILDDVRVYNRVLAPTEVAALYGLAPSVAPTLASSPSSRSVFPGGSCTFSAPAVGTLPLRYQWQYGTTNISGATNSSYVVTNVQATNVGLYSVTVTNIAGSTGASATLALLPTPTGNYETWVVGDKPEAYWRLNDTTSPILDSMGRHDGLPYAFGQVDSNLTYLTYGQPGALANNSDTCMFFSSQYQNTVTVPYSSNLNTVPFTVECWAQLYGSTPLSTYYAPVSSLAASGGDEGYLLYAAEDNLWESWLGEGGTSWSFNQGAEVQPNAWAHLVATFDGTNNCIYVNGVLSQSKVVTAFFQNLTSSFNIGCNGAQNGYYFEGYLDEVAFYQSALSATRVADHYDAAIYGSSVPPVVTSPASQTVLVGSTVTFTASVVGSPQLVCQWQKNGTSISGATNLSLILTNVYYTDAAQYTLAVTNSAGGVVGTPAVLAVMPSPTFANLTNSLVLHLKFDGNYSDSSGLGNNGAAVNSPAFVAGKVGSQAVQVSSTASSGSYNYVTIADPNGYLRFAAGQDFTVSMWVKVAPGSSTDLPFFGNQDASLLSTIAGYSFSPTTSGTWAYFIKDDAGNVLTKSSVTSIANNQWHNLVYSAQRSGNLNVYLDGQLSGSTSMASLSSSITPSYWPSVGQNGAGNYNVTASYDIDDLGVWQRALTSYDALSLYTAGASGQSFDVYGPVSMALQQSGSSLKITWQAGTLESATNINGPWTVVSGASAPYYTVTPGPGQMFFRIKL